MIRDRVRPIPGMIPIPGTNTRYQYPVSVSVWKKSVWTWFRYRFGIGDIWDIGIGIGSVWRILGISVSVYRYDTIFFNVISVSYICISVSYRYIDTDIPKIPETDDPNIPHTEPIPIHTDFFHTDTDTGYRYLVSVSYRVSVEL